MSRKGDLALATTHVEAILRGLAMHPYAGLDEPFTIYLPCYRVLEAAHDPRGAAILQQGHDLLHKYANYITDPRLRESFLVNVPVHDELRQTYAARFALGLRCNAISPS